MIASGSAYLPQPVTYTRASLRVFRQQAMPILSSDVIARVHLLGLKRAERVAQSSAPGSCKLQCPLVTAGDIISGHYQTNNAR